MTTSAILLLLLLASTFLTTTSAQPSLTSGCSSELVAFSPCLAYVSAPPNNVTESAPSQCCDAFSSSFESGGSNCFCHVFRQPLIFGFPLNQTRFLSLSSLCNTNRSLESICSSGSLALPPLSSTGTSSEIPKPDNSGTRNMSTPSIIPPPQSATSSQTTLSIPPSSSATHSVLPPPQSARSLPKTPSMIPPPQPARSSPATPSMIPPPQSTGTSSATRSNIPPPPVRSPPATPSLIPPPQSTWNSSATIIIPPPVQDSRSPDETSNSSVQPSTGASQTIQILNSIGWILPGISIFPIILFDM